MRAQSQAGWLQHDIGHFAVSRKSAVAAYLHLFVISFIKGASSKWWNYRHFLHHGKPNVVRSLSLSLFFFSASASACACPRDADCVVLRQSEKDPDITLPEVFVLGTTIPVELGKKKQSGVLPYQFQHLYYHIRKREHPFFVYLFV